MSSEVFVTPQAAAPSVETPATPETPEVQSQEAQGTEGTSFEQLSTENQGLVTNFVKLFGEPKKGQELVEENGKIFFQTYDKGILRKQSLQDIFDNYALSENAKETQLKAKAEYKAAETEKAKVQQLVKLIYENPDQAFDILEASGLDPQLLNNAAQKRLERAIKYAEMPEELRELERIKLERDSLIKEKQARMEQERLTQEQQREVTEYNNLKGSLYQAMVDHKLTEAKPELVEDVMASAIFKMKQAQANNIELKPYDAIELALNDLPVYINKAYNGLSDDQIRKLLVSALGQDRFMKIARGETVPGIKAATPAANNVVGIKSKTNGKKKTFEEYFGK